LELSDIAPRGTAHPGNEIVPTALSIAERDNLDGQALMAGIVAGYEIEIRFGRSVFPSAFYEGWWTPGLLGPIGVAMTAGRMMGFDAAKQANNLGIVLNLLPTATARANEEGGSVKWIIGGHATAAGLLAADMAAAGIGGMREIVEGWLPIVTTTNWPERLSEGIRADGSFEQYEILSGIITKHYSTVGPLTSALDATFDMILDHGIKADDVVEIEAECMKRTAVFNTVHPTNEVTARASLPYCLAVALLTGDRGQLVGPAFRQEMLNNKAVHDIAQRVRIVENEEYERQYPAKSLARVTLKLKDGTSHSKEVDRSTRGRYLTPTNQDIESKFRLITEPILGVAAASRIVDKVWNLETMKNVSGLVKDLILPKR
jgi:2-methylcitrate dehydratase PrpD